MDAIVRAKADELNSSLIEYIKAAFKGKKIALHIYEDDSDETAYLLSDPIAKKRLLESIENVNENRMLKEYTLNDIQSYLNDSGHEKADS